MNPVHIKELTELELKPLSLGMRVIGRGGSESTEVPENFS